MKNTIKQRTKEVKVRLTEGELARLNDNVALTGLSREQYLRLLIIHKTPAALPPADYRLLLRQMQWMETQLKELAGSQSTDENREQLDYTLQLLNSTVLLMQGAMLPRTFSPFTPNTPDGKEVNPYGGFAD